MPPSILYIGITDMIKYLKWQKGKKEGSYRGLKQQLDIQH